MTPVDEIKQKLDIVDVVGSFVQLKKSGKNYKGLCPFHGEKTPSFMVSPELQIFKCFGCGESGDMFSFIEKIEGIDFAGALERLAEKADVKIKTGYHDPQSQLKKQIFFINDLSAKFYNHILLNTKHGKAGLDYFKNRGFNVKIIKEFNLGFAPKSWDILYKFLKSKNLSDEDLLSSGVVVRGKRGGYIDKFIGRVIFPFTEIDGKVVGFSGRTIYDRSPKYMNTSETPVFNKSIFLYGLDKSRVKIKTEGAVIVEGPMDVISSHQNGIENIVASSGTAITSGHLKVLSRYTNNVTFCFDSDNAGVSAVYRAVDLAESQDLNIKAIEIPAPHKDLDDVLRADRDLAKELIKDALPVYDYFINTSLKRHDKNNAYGKKKIMQELSPRFSKIKNKVVLDHYIKELSERLELNEETIISSVIQGKSLIKDESLEVPETDERDITETYRKSPEHFFISLLLRGNIDIIRDFMYKIEIEDLQNPDIKTIYKKINEIIENPDKDFSPQELEKSLPEDIKTVFTDIYMWDLAELSDDTALLVKELGNVINRLKNLSIKRQLSSITERIKQAEKENNTRQLKELTIQFNNLSQKLNKV